MLLILFQLLLYNFINVGLLYIRFNRVKLLSYVLYIYITIYIFNTYNFVSRAQSSLTKIGVIGANAGAQSALHRSIAFDFALFTLLVL